MVNAEKLFNTIGIDPCTVLIKYDYLLEDIENDQEGKPFLFSGLEMASLPTKKEIHDEKAFLEKSEEMLTKMVDSLQKDIIAIQQFRGWYD